MEAMDDLMNFETKKGRALPKIRIGTIGKDVEMPSTNEECTKKVLELCQMLLEKKPIYIGEELYTDYKLPEFLCTLNNTYTFNLETVYDRFINALNDILEKQTKSLNLLNELIKTITNSNNHEN